MNNGTVQPNAIYSSSILESIQFIQGIFAVWLFVAAAVVVAQPKCTFLVRSKVCYTGISYTNNKYFNRRAKVQCSKHRECVRSFGCDAYRNNNKMKRSKILDPTHFTSIFFLVWRLFFLGYSIKIVTLHVLQSKYKQYFVIRAAWNRKIARHKRI